MKRRTAAIAALGFALASSPGHAAVVSLNFEGVYPTYPTGSNNAFVQGFYNGGTSSNGQSGTNFGVEFSDNALAVCLNSIEATCSNASHGGLGDPNSLNTGLFFLSGTQTFLNFAAGFDTGFSFNYTAINVGGSVTVYDGLNGTGNALGTLNLPTTPSACGPEYSAGYCPFVAAGLSFAGTALSISFAGVQN